MERAIKCMRSRKDFYKCFDEMPDWLVELHKKGLVKSLRVRATHIPYRPHIYRVVSKEWMEIRPGNILVLNDGGYPTIEHTWIEESIFKGFSNKMPFSNFSSWVSKLLVDGRLKAVGTQLVFEDRGKDFVVYPGYRLVKTRYSEGPPKIELLTEVASSYGDK